MRLFIALNFNNEVKAQIKDIINSFKSNSIQGRFVNEEHMHITVEFLGEIEKSRVDLIKDILAELEFKAFTLRLTNVGYFKRQDGNVYWLGIERNDTLSNVHKKLHQRLIESKFELEDREYKPHLTLGRNVKLIDSFNLNELSDAVGTIEIDINKVDLMKSEFINGKLKHSIVYSRQLS